MRVCRFHVASIPVSGKTVLLSPEESKHASRVLRLEAGDTVELLDGAGVKAVALIAAAADGKRKESVPCRIVERHVVRPPVVRIRLFVAIPRRKVMGQIVRDATQLGVWRISPIVCRHAVSRPERGKLLMAWHADMVCALKQSGNAFAPRLDAPCAFAGAIAEAHPPGYFGAVPTTAVDDTAVRGFRDGDLALWIGPEAGFSGDEQQALLTHGFQPLTVGRWTLTTETAVPVLLGALLGKV